MFPAEDDPNIGLHWTTTDPQSRWSQWLMNDYYCCIIITTTKKEIKSLLNKKQLFIKKEDHKTHNHNESKKTKRYNATCWRWGNCKPATRVWTTAKRRQNLLTIFRPSDRHAWTDRQTDGHVWLELAPKTSCIKVARKSNCSSFFV